MALRALVCCTVLPYLAYAAVFAVMTNADAGPGSLREAIELANTDSIVDEIHFGANASTLQLVSMLPHISAPVTMVGPVVIDGGGSRGLVLDYGLVLVQHNASTLINVAVANFAQSGIVAMSGSGHVLDNCSAVSNGQSGILVLNAACLFTCHLCYAGANGHAGLSSVATNTTITGGYYGVARDGRTASPNADAGLELLGDSAFVCDAQIAGNFASGVVIGGRSSTVSNCVIGLRATGRQALPNLKHGVYGNSDSRSLVLRNNTISGNDGDGVFVSGDGARIVSNRVGTDAAGMLGVGNGHNGIFISGNTADIHDNVVSGNMKQGVLVTGAQAALRSNYVGLAVDGLQALPNLDTGCNLTGNDAMVLNNVVSGNLYDGIFSAGDNAVIAGNRVGLSTALSLNMTFPNGNNGIDSSGAGVLIINNTVGGNGQNGIRVGGAGAVVQGNFVGTDEGIVLSVPNKQNGLLVVAGARGAVVEDNAVANNFDDGVRLEAPYARVHGNQISRNRDCGLVVDAQNCVVDNNTITNNGKNGIRVDGPDLAVFLTNNFVFDNRARALWFDSDVSAPELHFAGGGMLRFTLHPPLPVVNDSSDGRYSLLDVFGDARWSAYNSEFAESRTLLVQQRLTTLGSESGLQSINVTFPSNFVSVTAIVTYADAGSSYFSDPVVVIRNTDACAVCVCADSSVNCASSGISFIPTDFPPQTTLVDLSYNNLRLTTAVDWAPIWNLLNLTSLWVVDSHLESLSWLRLSAVLEELYLSENFFTELPAFGALFGSLVTLDLSYNPVTQLPLDTFAALPLQALYISDLSLAIFPDGVFDSLTSLLDLDISLNFLPNVSNAVLSSSLWRLEYLYAINAATDNAGIDISKLSSLQELQMIGSCKSGFYRAKVITCRRCSPGTFQLPELAEESNYGRASCILCEAGTVDADSHAQTPCQLCSPLLLVPKGSFGPCSNFPCRALYEIAENTNATQCTLISRGTSTLNASALGGALGGVLLFTFILVVAFVVRQHRVHREQNRPLSFDEQFAAMHAQGLIVDKGAHVIREVGRRHVKVLETLGEGQYGVVCKGLVELEHGFPEFSVAIKMLKIGASTSDKAEFMAEAAIMSQFQHKNVVSLVGVVTAGEPRMILLQLCDNGSLLSFLKSRTGFNTLQLEHKIAIMLDVACGMKYLCGLHVVHRDLAARNVLVSADFICKISDFGLSRDMGNETSEYYSSKRGLVPLRWTAPECLGTFKFSHASDVWAFGVLCGEVFDNGRRPFDQFSDQAVWLHVQSGHGIARPTGCSVNLFRDVVTPCFVAEPSKRATFSHIVHKLAEYSEHSSSAGGASFNAALDGHLVPINSYLTPAPNNRLGAGPKSPPAAATHGGYVYSAVDERMVPNSDDEMAPRLGDRFFPGSGRLFEPTTLLSDAAAEGNTATDEDVVVPEPDDAGHVLSVTRARRVGSESANSYVYVPRSVSQMERTPSPRDAAVQGNAVAASAHEDDVVPGGSEHASSVSHSRRVRSESANSYVCVPRSASQLLALRDVASSRFSTPSVSGICEADDSSEQRPSPLVAANTRCVTHV